jgi:hypothetical protein
MARAKSLAQQRRGCHDDAGAGRGRIWPRRAGPRRRWSLRARRAPGPFRSPSVPGSAPLSPGLRHHELKTSIGQRLAAGIAHRDVRACTGARLDVSRQIWDRRPQTAVIGVLSVVVLALRPEFSAQARVPPTARSAPRGGEAGVTGFGLRGRRASTGVTPPVWWLRSYPSSLPW